MKDAIKNNQVVNVNDICEELAECFYYIKRVLRSNSFDLAQAKKLAVQVMTIRSLLKELERVPETASRNSGRASMSISELQERYLELEGMVKEIRNDRS